MVHVRSERDADYPIGAPLHFDLDPTDGALLRPAVTTLAAAARREPVSRRLPCMRGEVAHG